MKKTVIAVLSIVLVLSLSMVALVACNNDDDNTASNSEVLGTAVALATQSLATGAGTAADDAQDDFQAGVNLTVGDGKLDAVIGAQVSGIAEMLQPTLDKVVNKVDQLLGENGVKVETATESDRDDYSQKITISGTYVDKKTGEEKTYSYSLYVGIVGEEKLEGTKDYTFNAMVVVPNGDEEPFTYEFSGIARFDKEKEAMVFALGADDKEYATAFAGIKAYSKKNGTVVLELGAGASVLESVSANASVTIELGKIDESGYGAVVTVAGEATVVGYGVSFNATVNVYANSTENAGEFNITGNVTATVNVPSMELPIVGSVCGKYQATANVEGMAKYDATGDQLNVGVSGNVSVQKVEENK